MKLINADELRKEFEECRDRRAECYWSDVIERVESAPEAVTRCIDCKHYCESNIRQFYFCTSWCMDFNREMHDPEKYFCADGERRAETGDV